MGAYERDFAEIIGKRLSGGSFNDRAYERPVTWAEAEQLVRHVLALCDRLDVLERAIGTIAEGITPPDKNGHYLAHRKAVAIAREAMK